VTELAAGKLADLPVDTGVQIRKGDSAVALFRIGDKVHAIDDRCSHAEASLAEGDVFDTEVECPRHGAAFDITTGKALTLPATQPVTVFATEVRDGHVFIEIPHEETAGE
jgi:3-phenylpropionate/trans-cinnamate dioxygenase ferredoxin subunit